MKYAPPRTGGASYIISFAIGATIVTASLWLGLYLFLCHQVRSPTEAYTRLPSFYIRRMWFAGGMCGILWSIGNFSSILSVEYLGEGVGYSVVQLNMLVSGVWGIFYFREIQSTVTVCKWFASAILAVGGILLLSYEHHAV